MEVRGRLGGCFPHETGLINHPTCSSVTSLAFRRIRTVAHGADKNGGWRSRFARFAPPSRDTMNIDALLKALLAGYALG